VSHEPGRAQIAQGLDQLRKPFAAELDLHVSSEQFLFDLGFPSAICLYAWPL